MLVVSASQPYLEFFTSRLTVTAWRISPILDDSALTQIPLNERKHPESVPVAQFWHVSILTLKVEWDSSKVILFLGDKGQYPADWPIFRLSEKASMHPFSFSNPLTTLKECFQFSTLCPRALRPSMTDWGDRKHTNQTPKPDYGIISWHPKFSPCQTQAQNSRCSWSRHRRWASRWRPSGSSWARGGSLLPGRVKSQQTMKANMQKQTPGHLPRPLRRWSCFHRSPRSPATLQTLSPGSPDSWTMAAVHLQTQLRSTSDSQEAKWPPYVTPRAGYTRVTLPALMVSARLQKSDSSLFMMTPVRGE